MKRPTAHKNDRLPVRRTNPTTPQARERVIAGLVASATSDFVYLVQWLKSGKQHGEPLQLSRWDSLRNAISHLETLDAGVQPDWRKVLTLVSREIHTSHNVQAVVTPPSKIAGGILSNLNDISQKIATGLASPDMLGRLNYMLQLTAGLAGGDELAQSIRKVSDSAEKALRGYDKPQAKPKTPKPAPPAHAIRDDQTFRLECAPLIGVDDLFVVANCLIAMSARLAKRAAALKGVIQPDMLADLLELLQQDVDLNALAPPPRVKDDNTRSDGGKLVGLTGVVEGGASIGAEAQRIITAELKKHSPLTSAQRVSFDTARAGLALESDTFRVIEEIRRIAASLNWRPLAVAAHAAHKSPGIRPEIAGDVITLLAQDETLTTSNTGR